MSLYNMMHGVNTAMLWVLPMLGKHPDEYPRFRDCFAGHSDYPQYDEHIFVYTRVGGGNRADYHDEIRELRANPHYVTDFDDDFDCTYAWFVFNVPDQWRPDYDRLMNDEGASMSQEYIAEIKRVFPKLADKVDAALSPPDKAA